MIRASSLRSRIINSLPRRVVYNKDGEVYLERFYLLRTTGLGLVLHRIVRPDLDERLHDHPWKWAFSLVISGAYVEQRLRPDGKIGVKILRRGCTNTLRATTLHRISQVRSGEVWTLFLHGARVKQWSFSIAPDMNDAGS